MQNVLTFPTTNYKKAKKFRFLQQIKNFLEDCKIRREVNYQEKIDFLKEESYKFYLAKILKERSKSRVVDFPDFMYRQGLVKCQEAVYLSSLVVNIHEKVYGRKFIEKCYKRQIKKTKINFTK